MNEQQVIKLALAGMWSALPIKWTIKPPHCAHGDGRLALNIYFDAEGKMTQYCDGHYIGTLAVEAARLFYRNTHKEEPKQEPYIYDEGGNKFPVSTEVSK